MTEVWAFDQELYRVPDLSTAITSTRDQRHWTRLTIDVTHSLWVDGGVPVLQPACWQPGLAKNE